MPSAADSKVLLVNVQFLRFVAALLVLLYHGAQGIAEQLAVDNPLRDVFLLIGFAGVDLFFVISGFIIYLSNMHMSGSGNALRFLCQRSARIFLGYWPFFFIAWRMLASLNTDRLQKVDLLSSFFLVPDKIYATLISVTWSLSFELYFYLLFSVLLFVPSRLRMILLMAAVVVAFNVFASYALKAYTWKGFNNISDGLRFMTSPWLLEFFAGCVVAHLIGRGWRAGAWWAVLSGLALFVLGYALNATMMEGKIAKFFNYHYRMSIFGGGSALLVYGLVCLEQRGLTLLPRASVLLGGASYSLYLCHTVILDALEYSGAQQWLIGVSVSPTLKYLAVLLSIQLFAVVCYRLIEDPVHRYARRAIARRFLVTAAKQD